MTPRSRMPRPCSPPVFSERVDEVREESAGEDGRSEAQRQVDAEGEDHGGFAEHLQNQGDQGADAEEKIGDRLAAHESHDQRLHDGGLRRGENLARVAGGGFAELEGVGQQDDGEAGGDGRGNDADELDLLLRGGRGAEPVAGLEVGDELAGDAERGADHARNGHDEEHARGAGEAEAQQHHRGDDDGEHGHAGGGIVGRGGDGVGGHRGKEEGEEQREREAQEEDGPGDLKAPEEDGDGEGAGDDAEKNGGKGDVAIGALGCVGVARNGRRAARCRRSRRRRAAI